MVLDKITYLKVKKIVLDELQKEYYGNAANVKEVVDLNTYDAVDENGKNYTHVENLQIYHNGMSVFNCFDRYSLFLESPYVVPPASIWSFNFFKDKPKQKRKSKRYVKNRTYK